MKGNQWHFICKTLEFEMLDENFTSMLLAESYPNIEMVMASLHTVIELRNQVACKVLHKALNIVDCQALYNETPCKKAMQLISIIIHKHLTKGGDV